MEDHVSASKTLPVLSHIHSPAVEIVEFANSIVGLVEEEIDKYKESIAEEEERIRSEDTEKVRCLTLLDRLLFSRLNGKGCAGVKTC